MEGGHNLYLDAADLHTLLRGDANYLRRKQVCVMPAQLPNLPRRAALGPILTQSAHFGRSAGGAMLWRARGGRRVRYATLVNDGAGGEAAAGRRPPPRMRMTT